MTSNHEFLAILANMCPNSPLDIDPLIFDAAIKANSIAVGNSPKPPSSALWLASDERISRIGVRVTTPLENAHFIAARLATIAVERQIIPIFLSYIGTSGVQRFGFRVEQVSGTTPMERDICEEQIKRFWNIAMIVDASDIARLG